MRQTTVRFERHPLWVDGCLLAFAIFVLYAACANYTGQQVTDNVSTFTAAWAVGEHGTLDLSAAPDIKPWTIAIDGELHSDRAPGLIGWVSLFYVGLGNPSFPTIFPAGIAAAAAAAMAIAVLFVVFARLVDRRRALLASLIAALGTATWTVSSDAVWPHGPDQLWLTLLLLGLSSRKPLLAGLAGGAALLTRPLTAVATALAGLTMAWHERRVRTAVKIALTSGLGLVALLVYNRVAFHVWTVTQGSYSAFVAQFAGRGDSYDPTEPVELVRNIAGVLFSPTRGIVPLSPFILLLIPGIPAAWRVAPGWVRAGALAGAGYAVAQVWGNNFAGGAGFYGYRYTIESLTLASPLLLLCWVHWTSVKRWRRTVFDVLVVIAIGQHAAGALYVTPSLPPGWSSWSHWMIIDALASANAAGWCVFIGTTAIAVAVISGRCKPRWISRKTSGVGSVREDPMRNEPPIADHTAARRAGDSSND
jgi:hypothetical protein